ncbi:hypothetical protein C1H46_032129 [Malus baccata]|uniref:Uncharacterized protein n=1 Tax=Malus baccata TaxID=106549 RepID=A0A540L728_MALBA|nr:hypothetical protein C1H46_032129 [Malus baccata]
MPIFGAVAAIAAAFSTGANNLPSPFSTPIGSGSLTLLKAFEAAFASCGSFVNDLFSDVRIKTLPVQLYFTSKEIENQPTEGFLMWSMVVVVETAGLLCLFFMFQVIPSTSAVHSRVTVVAVALAAMTGALLSLGLVIPLAMKKVNAAKIYKTVKRNMSKSINQKSTESQEQTCISTKSSDDGAQSEEALKDFLQMRVLGTVYEEEDERSWA